MAGLGLALVLAQGASAQENRWVRIHNDTGFDIITFRGSHVGTNSWEEDILGSAIFPTGRSININFDDGTGYCNFDLRAEFSDGDVLVRNNVNICEIGNIYFQ